MDHRALVRRASAAALVLFAPVALRAQAFTGIWRDVSPVQAVQLELQHDATHGRITGTLAIFGMRAPIEGTARGNRFDVTRMNGQPAADALANVSGRLDGGVLVLTVTEPGEPPQTMRLQRSGAAPTVAAAPASERSSTPSAPAAAPPRAAAPASSASARDFAGRWESVSDDGTTQEVVELIVTGDQARGVVNTYEHGYFSKTTKLTSSMAAEGAFRDGRLQLRLADASTGNTVAAQAFRRSAYLVLRIGSQEYGYARPGTPLVQRADDSAEARALARTISGRVYSTTKQALNSEGAIVGGRTKIAFCANGEIAYDWSDLASAGGVDMGSTKSRRGKWQIVLRAGAPAVLAQWVGSGSTYALTEYFDVRPAGDGRSAVVDGKVLPLTGSC
jgi:hypothetical protein